MSLRQIFNSWVTKSTAGEAVLMFGSLALVVLVVFFCMIFFRTRRSRRHRYRHYHAPESIAVADTKEEQKLTHSFSPFRRRRHRRRRRFERPLNPTLSQAGGLPPVRYEDQSPRV